MKKRYEVVGEMIVHGFKKGQKFAADLLEHEENLLIGGGHVRVVKDEPKPNATVTKKK